MTWWFNSLPDLSAAAPKATPEAGKHSGRRRNDLDLIGNPMDRSRQRRASRLEMKKARKSKPVGTAGSAVRYAEQPERILPLGRKTPSRIGTSPSRIGTSPLDGIVMEDSGGTGVPPVAVYSGTGVSPVSLAGTTGQAGRRSHDTPQTNRLNDH